jgi:diguanylate cyclase
MRMASGWRRAVLREPDPFDRVSEFLRHRGLLRPVRVLMAVVTSSAALVPISVLARVYHAPVGVVVVGMVAVTLSLVMAWLWLTRWPTRRQSVTSAVLGAVCVAAFSLCQPRPGIAALVCTAGAVTGGYIAFFHSSRVLLFNIIVVLTTAMVAAYRLAQDADPATAAAAFWLMWLLNITVPLAIRGISKAMSRYAVRATEDPLTGLLNRRGFLDAVNRRLIPAIPGGAHQYVVVMMIDLDNFKRVNDTQGHAAGDRTLLLVAELLRRYVSSEAAICRCGGEEFLIALTSASDDAAAIAAPLCSAIRAQCGEVTASIGVACADRHVVAATPTIDLIDVLVQAADLAMYKAKRNGGNRVELARHGRNQQ